MAAPIFQLLDAGGTPLGSVPLEADELILGREIVASLGAGLDPSVSRSHARVRRQADGVVIEDLESRNGTLVNGLRIDAPTALRAGDVVELGEQRFRFVEAAILEERAAPLLFERATLAASRPGAPERLRLIYDLTQLLEGSNRAAEIAQRLHAIVERTVRPAVCAAWLAGSPDPVAGDAQASPLGAALLQERVLGQGQALRIPGGSAPATALAVPLRPDPEPAGMLLVAAPEGRPFTDEDSHFVLAAAALAGVALRRAAHVRVLALEADDDGMVGESPALKRAQQEADLVAPYEDLSVLLVGETGTGKELFAQRIHRLSGRSGPFVAVNVAALPAELLESELFGNVKGAFTGATAARTGYVEYAAGGTLFLDEIGEMPAALQAKLLRVLQEKRMNRVGDPRPVDVDVRVVAATNADLRTRIADGSFREDLYYRLAAKEVRIPPLRERVGDVPLLARAFLRRNLGRTPRPVRTFSAEAMRVLETCPWPGNVRQLEGTVRLAAIHAAAEGATEIDSEHVDERVRQAARPAGDTAAPFARELEEAERRIVLRALEAAGGNKREAARLLGWSINTLRSRLQRYEEG